MPKVMLCHDLEDKKVVYPSCVGPKIDGVRAFYEPGASYLISRNDKPIYGMEHIIEQLSNIAHPVDMELSIPGMEFNELSGLIRNHKETPTAVGHIIDMVIPGTWQERRVIVRSLPESETIKIIPHWKVTNMAQIIAAYTKFLDEGYEGLVWKTLTNKYEDKRSWEWLRLVPNKMIDVEVVSVYEGTGKMKGMAGGFYFEYNGHPDCKCGTMLGIDYQARRDMLEHSYEYIGRTAIVEFKELQPSGKPRQPRFKGWRYDK